MVRRVRGVPEGARRQARQTSEKTRRSRLRDPALQNQLVFYLQRVYGSEPAFDKGCHEFHPKLLSRFALSITVRAFARTHETLRQVLPVRPNFRGTERKLPLRPSFVGMSESSCHKQRARRAIPIYPQASPRPAPRVPNQPAAPPLIPTPKYGNLMNQPTQIHPKKRRLKAAAQAKYALVTPN